MARGLDHIAHAVRDLDAGAGLYERLYSGDPEINAQRWFASPVTKDCEALVHSLLES